MKNQLKLLMLCYNLGRMKHISTLLLNKQINKIVHTKHINTKSKMKPGCSYKQKKSCLLLPLSAA